MTCCDDAPISNVLDHNLRLYDAIIASYHVATMSSRVRVRRWDRRAWKNSGAMWPTVDSCDNSGKNDYNNN